MRRFMAFALAFALDVSVLNGATLDVIVVTSGAAYIPGETVSWIIYAYASQDDNRGIKELSLILDVHPWQRMWPADTEEFFPGVYQLSNSDFGVPEGFVQQDPGTVDPIGEPLRGVRASQYSDNITFATLDVGQDDGVPPLPLFAQGSFTAQGGSGPDHCHSDFTLSVEVLVAKYWPSDTEDAMDFEVVRTTDAQYMGPYVSEPSSLILVGLGAGCLARRRRRRV